MRDRATAQRTVFIDYMVQSKAENNRISFFVKIENLSRALRSCCSSGSEHMQLKLTKKQGQPTLSFEIHESGVQVLHEVPIRIVTDFRETHQYAARARPGACAAANTLACKSARSCEAE